MVARYSYLGKRRWPSECRKFGDDDLKREKYYAYMKHKAQAKFRGDSYELDFEDFCDLWTDELWPMRGRQLQNLCLTRYDFQGEWAMHNVRVCSRAEHFKMKREQGERNRL
jgi:hypothetical protein